LASAKLPQGPGQALHIEKLQHRSALAAGDDESVAGLEFLSRADFHGTPASALHCFAMRLEIALEGEDTDRFHYQPRVCRSSLSGSLETSRPRMASPNSSLASSSFAGSL